MKEERILSKLTGKTATLSICNTLAMTIRFADVLDDFREGELIEYQWGNDGTVHTVPIEYRVDDDGITGCNNTDIPQPCFIVNDVPFFIAQFCRDNIGGGCSE